MILIVLVFWLVGFMLLLLTLCMLVLSIGAIVSSLNRKPNNILDFFNGYFHFWSDLWYNTFRKEKTEKK